VPGSYDDAVRTAQEDAERHGRTVISDTAYADCEDVPAEVMQGYTILAAELVEAWGEAPPTHVFVQAGVGGLAAAVAAHLWRTYGPARPHFAVVEPEGAACLLASARHGEAVSLKGELNTALGCLRCGVPSSVAWRILDRAADAFVAIPDEAAFDAMRRLARSGSDPAVTASESGAAGVAALVAIARSPSARASLRLGHDARVACIVTEGANDPERYREIVMKGQGQGEAP
jgi:diaminopropionate ammonia-lyase